MKHVAKLTLGFAQIPLLIGLLIMAIAVPVATSLVQQNQDIRNKAAVSYNYSLCGGLERMECAYTYGCSWQNDSCVGRATVTLGVTIMPTGAPIPVTGGLCSANESGQTTCIDGKSSTCGSPQSSGIRVWQPGVSCGVLGCNSATGKCNQPTVTLKNDCKSGDICVDAIFTSKCGGATYGGYGVCEYSLLGGTNVGKCCTPKVIPTSTKLDSFCCCPLGDTSNCSWRASACNFGSQPAPVELCGAKPTTAAPTTPASKCNCVGGFMTGSGCGDLIAGMPCNNNIPTYPPNIPLPTYWIPPVIPTSVVPTTNVPGGPTSIPGGGQSCPADACAMPIGSDIAAKCCCGIGKYYFNQLHGQYYCGTPPRETNPGPTNPPGMGCIGNRPNDICTDRKNLKINAQCVNKVWDYDIQTCNQVGRAETCGGTQYCCPAANGSYSTDMTKCPTAGKCTRNATATALDFSIWNTELRAGGFGTVSKTTWQTDYNCDGKINLVDFSIWREAFIKIQNTTN